MEILEILLGRQALSSRGILGGATRWVVGCGCLMLVVAVAGIVLLIAGIINFGESALTVIMVFAMIVVAVISMIRSSLGY